MKTLSPAHLALPLALLFGGRLAPAQTAAPVDLATPNLAAPLTLAQSIAIALRNQGQPLAAQLQAQSARENIASARAFGLPQVTGSVGYNYLNQTVRLNSPLIPSGAGTGTNAGTGTSVGNVGGIGTGTNVGSGTVGTGTIGTGTIGNGTNFGTNFGTVNGLVSGTNSSTTTNIAVTQNIFDGGRTRQQVRAAQARSQSAVGSFGNARNGLAFLVAQRFYEQLRQEQLARQFEGQVALAAQQVAQVQAQIEAGTAARADILSVQVTLRQRQFDLTTARNDLAKARVSFRNALGLPRGPQLTLAPGAELARIAGTSASAALPIPPINASTDVPDVAVPEVNVTLAPATPPNVPALEPLEIYLAQAQRLRPDLVQARAAIAQNEAALALTSIEERPQVAASAGFNVDPRSRDQRAFNVGLGLTVPIFNGGGRRADTRAARDALAATRVTLAQTQKDADADVEASYTDVSGQVERIANARVLVEQAQLNLATATEKYRLGLGIVLDIVNAQTQLFNAQVSATGATYDYELARAALDRSVGRFAWADPGEAPPLAAPIVVPVNLGGRK